MIDEEIHLSIEIARLKQILFNGRYVEIKK
jgi:hypothetical protein